MEDKITLELEVRSLSWKRACKVYLFRFKFWVSYVVVSSSTLETLD